MLDKVHSGVPVSYTHLDVYKRQVDQFHVHFVSSNYSGLLAQLAFDVQETLNRESEDVLLQHGYTYFIVVTVSRRRVRRVTVTRNA